MQLNKIALLCDTLGGGGAEQVMSSLAKLFSSEIDHVDFLVARKEGVYVDKVEKYANLIDLNTRARFMMPKLISYMRKEKPQVILSTQGHINIASALSSSFVNTKSILREATTPSIALKLQNRSKWPLRLTYKLADRIVSVSDGVKQDLETNFSLNPNNIQTIYNPIISEDLYDSASEKVEHPWFSKKTPVIISMGRFAKAKDYPTLIKAFNIIRKSIDCKLMILGDHECDLSVKDEVASLIDQFELTKDIDLLGFKKNPFPYIKNSSLYILSSMYEGLPGALIQAKALGCHVVSTDCESGPREILENGENGILVPVKNYRALAEAAIGVLKSNETSKPLSSNFKKKYTSQGVTDQYLSLFKELISKPGK